MRPLVDHDGRSFPYLRPPLTEACNFCCADRLPAGYQADGCAKFFALDEIRRRVRQFAALRMTNIRLAGGESGLRKDLPAIIAAGRSLPGIRRIALTTDGCRLPRLVRDWREAGLTALSVRLDSLRATRLLTRTGHDCFAEVTAGIEEALRLGFEVKVNAVLLRGCNDDELPAWLEFLRERDLSVRFIDGDDHEFFARHHLRAGSLQQQLLTAGLAATRTRRRCRPGFGVCAPRVSGAHRRTRVIRQGFFRRVQPIAGHRAQ